MIPQFWEPILVESIFRILVCLLWQVVPDSDAHRAGLQEGDQVLSVNDVDFQDIEHSKVSQSKLVSQNNADVEMLLLLIPGRI